MKMKQTVLTVVITFFATIGLLFVLAEIDDHFLFSDEKDLFDEISYEVPSEFEYDNYGNFKMYDYFSAKDDLSCSLSASATEKYDNTFNSWFKDEIRVNLNDKVGEMENLDVNGLNILHINVRKDGLVYDYYGVESGSYYYLFEYRLYDHKNGDRGDTKSNLCFTAKDKILNSIKLK